MEPETQEPTEIVETPRPREMAIALSERHAKAVMQNVDSLTKNFKTWMEAETDYTRELFGRSEKPSLLDPGAHKLTSFFRAYPDPHILERIEEREPGKERIKYVVRADIIHVSGVRIGSGVGSCTTDETKYQYRWLTEYRLKQHGYTDQEIKELPSQTRNGSRRTYTVYRIRNPEILDLDNTILKMATKRAEVDAALSLPGVSGVFTQDIEQYPDALGLNDAQPPQEKQEKKSPGVGPPPKQPPRKVESDTVVKERHPPVAEDQEEPDPDIENVLNAFLERDLRTTGANQLITKKKQGSVWVQHPATWADEQVKRYEEAMVDAGLEPVYHGDRWEVPI